MAVLAKIARKYAIFPPIFPHTISPPGQSPPASQQHAAARHRQPHPLQSMLHQCPARGVAVLLSVCRFGVLSPGCDAVPCRGPHPRRYKCKNPQPLPPLTTGAGRPEPPSPPARPSVPRRACSMSCLGGCPVAFSTRVPTQ